MAAKLSDAWLDELRGRLNIVDVVSEYVPLKQKGRRYWGLCPFHNEKTASFSVDADQQMYYCFGCHKGGDLIRFVMELERMEFMDAVNLLAERAHLPLPKREAMPGADASRALRERIYEANAAAARYYHDAIWTPLGAQALNYLHKRGLDDACVRRFGLGAAGGRWDELTEHLAAQGFEEDVLVAAGLTVRREEKRFDMFRERVIFPIINAQNRVLGFGARALDGGNPKYLNTSDTPVFNKRQGLYAMNFVRRERGLTRLVLVEGYMDVVSLRAHGIEGVVATLGTALTAEQARLIKRYAPEVWVGYDGDAAGQKAILRALDIFEDEGIKARVLAFPDGQDPDDFIRAQGLDGFGRLKPKDAIEYRMERAADGLDLSTQEGRTEYAIACCGILKKAANPVELDLYLGRLSVQTGFARDVLLSQVGVTAPAPMRASRPRARVRRLGEEAEPEDRRAQRMLVALLASRLIAPETVSVDDFDDPLYRELAGSLLGGLTPAAALDRIREEDRERAARALNVEVLPDERAALAQAEDCLDGIRKARANREVERLKVEAKTAESERKRELLSRINELNQIIKMTKAK